jgi:hypothetical protein
MGLCFILSLTCSLQNMEPGRSSLDSGRHHLPSARTSWRRQERCCLSSWHPCGGFMKSAPRWGPEGQSGSTAALSKWGWAVLRAHLLIWLLLDGVSLTEQNSKEVLWGGDKGKIYHPDSFSFLLETYIIIGVGLLRNNTRCLNNGSLMLRVPGVWGQNQKGKLSWVFSEMNLSGSLLLPAPVSNSTANLVKHRLET